MSVDLHIHSTASDGSQDPMEIIAEARELKLRAVAITDHDTVDGAKLVIESGIPSDLQFLSGVEISSSPPSPFTSSGNFHILGYGFDLSDPGLNEALSLCQRAREERNPKIVSRLNQLGMDVTLEEVSREAGGGLIGRPHMATLLVKKGYIGSIKEAFDTYLAKGKPAYVDKFRIGCEEAIGLIRSAGGIPVLAHPISLEMDENELTALVSVLKEMGLGGIEAYYSNHSPSYTSALCELASEKDLLVTGGTDYHGSLKNSIKMGSGRGDLSIPYAIFETLTSALS